MHAPYILIGTWNLLTVSAILRQLKVSQRGTPLYIFSDNGINFKSGERQQFFLRNY